MYCSKCGSSVNSNSKFCGNCGNQLAQREPVVNYSEQNANDKINKKVLFSSLIIVLVLAIGLIVGISFFQSDSGRSFFGIFSSDEKDDSNNESSYRELNIDKGTRTVMVYMVGSDLESQGGAASLDVNEIIETDFDEEDVKVVLYLGGSKKWYYPNIDAKENAIYEIENGELKKVKSYEVTNMASSKTLTGFIDYVYENYESDLYDLILWDHGGGPLGGYGQDENFNNVLMSLYDLEKALNDSKLLKETKFELIGFDACLMSSIEIVNMLKEEANYLVASAEAEPGYGWDYEFLSEIEKTTSSV